MRMILDQRRVVLKITAIALAAWVERGAETSPRARGSTKKFTPKSGFLVLVPTLCPTSIYFHEKLGIKNLIG